MKTKSLKKKKKKKNPSNIKKTIRSRKKICNVTALPLAGILAGFEVEVHGGLGGVEAHGVDDVVLVARHGGVVGQGEHSLQTQLQQLII